MSRTNKVTSEVNTPETEAAKKPSWLHRRLHDLAAIVQYSNIAFRIVLAVSATTWLIFCSFGWTPWLTLSLTFGETVVPEAGTYLQIGLCAFAILQASTVSDKVKLMSLQGAERFKNQTQAFIIKAYEVAHAADKAGEFTATEQYDKVEERFKFVQKHPDLEHMSDDILQTVAKMSVASSGLSAAFSDDKVARLEAALQLLGDEQDRYDRWVVKAHETLEKYRAPAQVALERQQDVEHNLRMLKQIFDERFVRLGFAPLQFKKKEADVPAQEPLVDPADTTHMNGHANGSAHHM